MPRKMIGEFELIDHGIEHEQYFQGCGTAFTSFEDVATGIGDNPAEAIDDALESLAQMDWDTEGMERRIIRECLPKGRRTLPTKPRVLARHGDEAHYYISIRVKAARWNRIVFAQGEDANEPLSILDAKGEEAAIEYLAQWDNGDKGEEFDEPAAGESDDVYETDDGFRLSYNTHLGYIGLERRV